MSSESENIMSDVESETPATSVEERRVHIGPLELMRGQRSDTRRYRTTPFPSRSNSSVLQYEWLRDYELYSELLAIEDMSDTTLVGSEGEIDETTLVNSDNDQVLVVEWENEINLFPIEVQIEKDDLDTSSHSVFSNDEEIVFMIGDEYIITGTDKSELDIDLVISQNSNYNRSQIVIQDDASDITFEEKGINWKQKYHELQMNSKLVHDIAIGNLRRDLYQLIDTQELDQILKSIFLREQNSYYHRYYDGSNYPRFPGAFKYDARIRYNYVNKLYNYYFKQLREANVLQNQFMRSPPIIQTNKELVVGGLSYLDMLLDEACKEDEANMLEFLKRVLFR